MLDGAGRSSAHRRRHTGRAVRRHDDARRSRSLGAPRDRAQVVRIGDLVEAYEERRLRTRERPGIRIAERLAPGDEPLVIARPGGLAQHPLGLHLQPRSLVEPRACRCSAFRRPDLEHLARATVRLADGIPSVHDLAGHAIRTSR
jgi:hypothetical protein